MLPSSMQDYLKNNLLLSRPAYHGRYLLSGTGLCFQYKCGAHSRLQTSNHEHPDRSFSDAIIEVEGSPFPMYYPPE
jgi:hypothetical protein